MTTVDVSTKGYVYERVRSSGEASWQIDRHARRRPSEAHGRLRLCAGKMRTHRELDGMRSRVEPECRLMFDGRTAKAELSSSLGAVCRRRRRRRRRSFPAIPRKLHSKLRRRHRPTAADADARTQDSADARQHSVSASRECELCSCVPARNAFFLSKGVSKSRRRPRPRRRGCLRVVVVAAAAPKWKFRPFVMREVSERAAECNTSKTRRPRRAWQSEPLP